MFFLILLVLFCNNLGSYILRRLFFCSVFCKTNCTPTLLLGEGGGGGDNIASYVERGGSEERELQFV